MADSESEVPEILREFSTSSEETMYLLYQAQTTLNTITNGVDSPVPYISDHALESMGAYLHLDIELVMDMLAALVNTVVQKIGISRKGLQELIDSGEEISSSIIEEHKSALWENAPQTALFSATTMAFFMGALSEAYRNERSEARKLGPLELPEEDTMRLMVATAMEEIMKDMFRSVEAGNANDDAVINPIGASLNTMKAIHSGFDNSAETLALTDEKAALFSFMVGIVVGRKLEQA